MRQLKATLAICAVILAALSGGVVAADAALQLYTEDVEVEPGETVSMNVTITNEGDRTTAGAYEIAATSNSSHVNVTSTSIEGPIQANETVNTSVDVSASKDVEHGASTIDLGLYSADGELVVTTTFEVVFDQTSNDNSVPTETQASATETEAESGAAVGVLPEHNNPWYTDLFGIPPLEELLPDWIPFL